LINVFIAYFSKCFSSSNSLAWIPEDILEALLSTVFGSVVSLLVVAVFGLDWFLKTNASEKWPTLPVLGFPVLVFGSLLPSKEAVSSG
jgi:hypothetical protein